MIEKIYKPELKLQDMRQTLCDLLQIIEKQQTYCSQDKLFLISAGIKYRNVSWKL